MSTTEVFKTAKWDSLHFMYKVKLATLAYNIFYDCTPPSMGHILTKKTSPIHDLRTMNTVIVPHFNVPVNSKTAHPPPPPPGGNPQVFDWC